MSPFCPCGLCHVSQRDVYLLSLRRAKALLLKLRKAGLSLSLSFLFAWWCLFQESTSTGRVHAYLACAPCYRCVCKETTEAWISVWAFMIVTRQRPTCPVFVCARVPHRAMPRGVIFSDVISGVAAQVSFRFT